MQSPPCQHPRFQAIYAPAQGQLQQQSLIHFLTFSHPHSTSTIKIQNLEPKSCARLVIVAGSHYRWRWRREDWFYCKTQLMPTPRRIRNWCCAPPTPQWLCNGKGRAQTNTREHLSVSLNSNLKHHRWGFSWDWYKSYDSISSFLGF